MRKAIAAALVGGMAVVLSASVGAADDKKDKKKELTIKLIMKGHGAKGPLRGLEAHVKGGMWDEAKKDAELIKEFGEALETLKPEKGTDESWKKLAGAYKESTAAVHTAVEKKDAAGTTAALKKIATSCKGCHSEHK